MHEIPLSLQNSASQSGYFNVIQEDSQSSGYKRIKGLLLKYRKTLVVGLIAIFTAGASLLCIGRGLQWLIDSAFSLSDVAAQQEKLKQGIMGLILLSFILSVSSFVRLTFLTKVAEFVIRDYRAALFGHISRLPFLSLQVHAGGELTTRMVGDTAVVQTMLATGLPHALRSLVMFLGGVIMMVTLSTKLTLVVLFSAVALLMPIKILGGHVRKRSRKAQDKVGELGGAFNETLDATPLIRVMGRSAWQEERFFTFCDEVCRGVISAIQIRGLLSSMVIVIILLAISSVLWLGGQAVIAGELTAGILAAFVFYAVIVASSAGGLADIYGEILRAQSALSRLEELFALSLITSQQGTTKPPFDLRFNNVTYTYPHEVEPTLQDLSLSIPFGQTIALVGMSGGGKSTLVKLLLGLCEPSLGNITINGDLQHLNTLYGQLGYVPQDAVMLNGTVRENITFGAEKVSDQALQAVARLTCAEAFILTLPQGYDTPLGPHGLRLSGGQRQRIALARALLMKPSLLILDEATAALDNITEAQVYRNMQQAEIQSADPRTTILIAHRLGTIQHADRIYVLEAGRIIEEGSHEELMANNGSYATLAQREIMSPTV